MAASVWVFPPMPGCSVTGVFAEQERGTELKDVLVALIGAVSTVIAAVLSFLSTRPKKSPNQPRPHRSAWLVVVLVVASLLIGAGVAYAGSLLLTDQRATVPSLVGLSRADAESELRRAGLVPASRALAGGGCVQDRVTAQDEPAGTKVDSGRTITFTYCGNPVQTAVPGLVGQSRQRAENALRTARLVPKGTGRSEPGCQPDQVLQQGVAAGTRVDEGTEVAYTYCDGSVQPSPSQVSEPPRPDVVLTVDTTCYVVPGGGLGGGDALTITFRVRSRGEVPYSGTVNLTATSDSGLKGEARNVSVKESPASNFVQVEFAGQDYGRTHTFTLVARPNEKITESNEGNNTVTRKVRLPTVRPPTSFQACV